MTTARAIEAAALVLAKCQANDPWFPHITEAMTLAWAEHIAITNLDTDDLLTAVTKAYSAHGHGFKPLPADIIGTARAIRNDRHERRPLPICAAVYNPEAAQRVRALAAELAETKGALPAAPPRYRRPVSKPRIAACPHCRAGIGQRCYNAATKQPLRLSAHPARIDAAQSPTTE